MRTFLIALLLLSGWEAQSKSYLRIDLNNTNYIVIFDGSLYNANGKFEGEVDAGKHAISILKHDYNLTTAKVKTEIVYEGTLDLSDAMFYTYKLSTVYLNFVSVDVYSPAVSHVESSSATHVTTTNATVATGTAMDAANFETFLGKLADKGMDSNKQDFVKSTMKNNWFSSDQVLQILQQFSFESGKVDVAKLLWHKTTDKGNFFKVYDAFNFSSSEKAVQEYVDNQN